MVANPYNYTIIQLYNEFVLLFHNSVYHILKTCHTSKNLWIIDNFAGFKFCSLRVSLAKSQWARLVDFIIFNIVLC